MGERTERELSPEDVYDGMEPVEPYTAGELASYFDAPKRHVRALLERLADAGEIRKKQPELERTIWIREAPVHDCPHCGFRYELTALHPVLSAVKFCPQCGEQV